MDEAALLAFLNIRHWRGWTGAFTREQADGALYPTRSRVKKINCEGGDATPAGTRGTVLGSIRSPGEEHCGYFVEWDNNKRTACFVIEWKLARV